MRQRWQQATNWRLYARVGAFVVALACLGLLVLEVRSLSGGGERRVDWRPVCKRHSYRYAWEELEMAHAAQHNEYYRHEDLFFMAQGWPLLLQAVEELSKLHVQQAKRGWFEVEPDFSSVGLDMEEVWNALHPSDGEEAPGAATRMAEAAVDFDDVTGVTVVASALTAHWKPSRGEGTRVRELAGDGMDLQEVERAFTHSAVDDAFTSRRSLVHESYFLAKAWKDCWEDRMPDAQESGITTTKAAAEKAGRRRAGAFSPIDDAFQDRKVLPASAHAGQPHYFRMAADPFCTFLWMLQLRQEPIRRVDDLLAVVTKTDAQFLESHGTSAHKSGFKPQQNGGMKASLRGINAYFKPCTLRSGNGESFLSEIMAFQIDRLFQFNRIPATVPRTIAANDLKALAVRAIQTEEDENAVSKIQSILRHCGYGNAEGAEGSFVGWSNFDVTLLKTAERQRIAPRLADLSEEEVEKLRTGKMNITRNSRPEEIEWALEVITGHMFGTLIGTLTRFRHNQHYMVHPLTKQLGPSILLDNDRSQWRDLSRDVRKGNPMEVFCVFPKRLSERIMMMDSTHIRAGDILLQIARMYAKTLEESGANGTGGDGNEAVGELLWNADMTKQLQANIHYLTKVVQACIKRHGEEKVLIPEYWDSSVEENFSFPGQSSFFDFLLALLEAS